MAFSSDGKMVASLEDSAVRLWNATTGEKIQNLQAHGRLVDTVVYSEDEETVASVSTWHMRSMRPHNAVVSEEIQRLERYGGSVNAVSFQFDTRDFVKEVRIFAGGGPLGAQSGQDSLSTYASPASSEVFTAQPTVLLDSPWVKRNGLDILWRAHEYRGICWTVSGSSLAIGQSYGTITILSFR